MLPTSIASSISIGSPHGDRSPASTVRKSSSSKSKSRPGSTPIRWASGRLAPAKYPAPWIAASLTTGTWAPTGPMNPGGPISASISSGVAWRNWAPSALVSLISFRRWSPRTSARTIPRPSTITGIAFSAAPETTPSAPATSSTVVRPGVGTSRGSSSAGGSSTGCACAEAISTFAA